MAKKILASGIFTNFRFVKNSIMKVDFRKALNFNKGQRRAVFMLSVLIITLWGYRFYQSHFQRPEVESDYRQKELLRKSALLRQRKEAKKSKTSPKKQITKWQDFDPNIISYQDAMKLGFTAEQARHLTAYRKAGGQFLQAKDLKKIYSISNADYQKMETYIKINWEEEDQLYTEQPFDDVESPNTVLIEINTAKQSDLLDVRGVGPYLSKNMVQYRKMLGGFVNKNQLMEVYGIDSTNFDLIASQIEILSDSVHRFNLKTVGFNDLKRHPYISKKLAFSIINYRSNIAPFKTVKDLLKVKIVNDSIFQKIYPYFVVE